LQGEKMDYSRKEEELIKKRSELDEIFSLGDITEEEYKQQKSEIDFEINHLELKNIEKEIWLFFNIPPRKKDENLERGMDF
jgi:phage-related minor tail protein